MEISVVIPTYNGVHKVLKALKSLEGQSFSDFETIVVIDGSTDNTVAELELFRKNTKLSNFQFIYQDNLGRPGARNTGAKAAKGDLLIFFDDDMRVGRDFIKMHLYRHQQKESGIIVGSQVEDSSMMKTDIQKYKRSLSIKWQQSISSTFIKLNKPYLTAANFSVSKSVFFRLKGFDERLTDCEDYDLAIRSMEIGIPIYFDPGIIGWHDDFVTAKKYLKRLKEYSTANKYLASLRELNNKTYSANHVKKIFYWPLSFPVWVKCIDAQAFVWIPQKVRYKLYSAIFHSQSQVFTR